MNIDKTYFGYFGKAEHSLNATCIVIHHTCTANAERTRKSLKGKKYSTHFEVEKDGTIYQYRDVKEQCVHCGSANCHAIGIDVTHIKNAPWPEAQVNAVKALVSYLCKELNIPHEVHMELSGIYPHKAIGCTACPQNFPMDALNECQS